jgi:hypothetical protein
MSNSSKTPLALNQKAVYSSLARVLAKLEDGEMNTDLGSVLVKGYGTMVNAFGNEIRNAIASSSAKARPSIETTGFEDTTLLLGSHEQRQAEIGE